MDVDDQISILAVDDQPENLLALEAILTNPEFRLVKARSGQEALKYLLDGEFAVILMDAHMPVMDGFETAKAIRSREKTRYTPIIFLTATHKDSLHAAEGYDIGAVDYIFKPVIPEILRAKVSVFVELFKKTKEIRRQADELAAYKTDLERSLARLLSLNEELQKMTDAADSARDQALSASRFKSEFLANMSHEIRTPLNGILGMIEILIKSGLTDKQREYATTVKEAGQSLLSVISDILDFSKIEAGKLNLEIIDFEPVTLVESIAELLAAQAHQQKLSLLTFIDPEIPRAVLGDPGRLRQIVTNLAGNAIKFSDRGEVLIRAIVESQTGRSLTIKFSVSDRGVGLTEDEISQLFQPFVQPDQAASRRYGGTGLGLSISKRLVELMGGQIGVTSVKNHGSTFWFSVPLEQTPSPCLKAPAPVGLNGIRALIVDDEPGAREILHNYLIAWGMRNGTASSAEEALPLLAAAAAADPYHVALIDLVMPGMDGLHLGKAIRENESLKDMKLILITALDKPGTGEESIFLGFDAYLTKPIKQSRLLNTITTLIYGESQKIGEQLLHRTDDQSSSRISPWHRPELILVAEDHPINQRVAILLLRELGFEVQVVENGLKAVESLKRVPYSLVFMDCQMPEMDGFQATRSIRNLEALTGRHVPIVAMTAHALEGNKEDCLACGMDDYISKPIDAGQLKSVINKWLPAPAGAPPRDGLQTESQAEEKRAEKREIESAPIDIAALHSKFGDHTDRMLTMFIEDVPPLIVRLNDTASAQGAAKLLQHTHGLRGICATVSADSMRSLCAQLETAVHESRWEAVTTLLKQLEIEFKRIKDFVNRGS